MAILRNTLFLLVLAALLSGCATSIQNLTSTRIPENPSNIYTISMTVENRDGAVVRDSFRPKIVIDGESYPMEPSDMDPMTFNFDYQMPRGRSQAAYYFIVEYDVQRTGVPRTRTMVSDLYNLQLINRYIVRLQSDRAPIGQRVSLLGRGFFESDQVLIGGLEAQTRFRSGNELEFVVPPLQANRSYPVEVRSGRGILPVGMFRIDESTLEVNRDAVQLGVGDSDIMVFQIDFEAPVGGVLVDVTTNIPRSIIMPEVIIREGETQTSVRIEGARPGRGFLYANVPGTRELLIPIEVVE